MEQAEHELARLHSQKDSNLERNNREHAITNLMQSQIEMQEQMTFLYQELNALQSSLQEIAKPPQVPQQAQENMSQVSEHPSQLTPKIDPSTAKRASNLYTFLNKQTDETFASSCKQLPTQIPANFVYTLRDQLSQSGVEGGEQTNDLKDIYTLLVKQQL